MTERWVRRLRCSVARRGRPRRVDRSSDARVRGSETARRCGRWPAPRRVERSRPDSRLALRRCRRSRQVEDRRTTRPPRRLPRGREDRSSRALRRAAREACRVGSPNRQRARAARGPWTPLRDQARPAARPSGASRRSAGDSRRRDPQTSRSGSQRNAQVPDRRCWQRAFQRAARSRPYLAHAPQRWPNVRAPAAPVETRWRRVDRPARATTGRWRGSGSRRRGAAPRREAPG